MNPATNNHNINFDNNLITFGSDGTDVRVRTNNNFNDNLTNSGSNAITFSFVAGGHISYSYTSTADGSLITGELGNGAPITATKLYAAGGENRIYWGDGTSGDDGNSGLTMGFSNVTMQYGVVPEPSSTALLGLGGLALILRRRK